MNEREIADWEREIKHAERMQEQRASKSRPINILELIDLKRNKVKDNDNEINR